MFDYLYRAVDTTEKARTLAKQSKYMFDTDETLTKPELKKLFEAIYDIKIVKVHCHNLPLKRKRVRSQQGFKARRKRVILTLQKGTSLGRPKLWQS